MRDLKGIFETRKIEYDKLIKYGFVKRNNTYIYEHIILNNFKMIVEINKSKQLSRLIDLESNDDYVLVDVLNVSGTFILKLKDIYENILQDIINNCTTKDIFKCKQTKELIKYIKDKYDDELEYLWDKFPNNAIVRNKSNQKWYVLFVTIEENKLGIASNKEIEAIVVRYQKDKIHEIIDNKNVFYGYHMNKKSWITIKLDGDIELNQIYMFVDNSYNL